MKMFEGIQPKTVHDSEQWLYAHGYHHLCEGDFRVQFVSGGMVDLREILADFADTYFAELQGRVKAWQTLAEDMVNVKPSPPKEDLICPRCNQPFSEHGQKDCMYVCPKPPKELEQVKG
jgi:hypothetical protein